MKLITEEINQVQFIVEESNGKRSLFIEGVFLQGNVKNRNGRVYRTETLKREVDRYITEHVNRGRALGELGHPDGPTVNLDRRHVDARGNVSTPEKDVSARNGNVHYPSGRARAE